MPSEAQDDLLVCIALADLSYKFKDVDQPVADHAWALSQEYARRQGLEPTEAVDQFEWSDGCRERKIGTGLDTR